LALGDARCKYALATPKATDELVK